MNPEVFLQMVLVFEGLSTLVAFELAVAGCLVEQLVLRERKGEKEGEVEKKGKKKTLYKHGGGKSSVNNHNQSA